MTHGGNEYHNHKIVLMNKMLNYITSTLYNLIIHLLISTFNRMPKLHTTVS